MMRNNKKPGVQSRTPKGGSGFDIGDMDVQPTADRQNPEYWHTQLVVASASGYAPDWASAVRWRVEEDRPLKLGVADIPIHGHVLDLEGRPVSGVSVRLHSLLKTRGNDAVERWIKLASDSKASRDDQFFPGEYPALPGSEPAVAVTAITDRDGRFTVSGLSRDAMATLDLTGPTIAARRVQIVTRKLSSVVKNDLSGLPLWDMAYYGADSRSL